MVSFGPKRKARKIAVDEDDTAGAAQQNNGGQTSSGTETNPSSTMPKFSKRPLKHSSLRKSTNVTDSEPDRQNNDADSDEGSQGPVVIKPTISRSSSLRGQPKTKKRKVGGGRLSFGPGEADSQDVNAVIATPKKGHALSHQAIVNSASRNLPMRATGTGVFAGDDEAPRYSAEFLAELQSSTPSTPARQQRATSSEDGEAMELDESELEGAVVVETTAVSHALLAGSNADEGTRILTQAEISERKARRQKLALQADAPDEGDYISFSTDRVPKKHETRLVPEDEDLGEGFDDFVEDGGFALGKKAEREARRRQRREMEDLINEAEDDESEDDSEAERIAAFEDAQTRAGMEGLQQAQQELGGGGGYYAAGGAGGATIPAPAKFAPIPSAMECLARFRATMKAMEDDIAAREKRLEEWKEEMEQIEGKEEEIQRKLAEAGETYRKLLGGLTGSEEGEGGGGGGGGGEQADGDAETTPLRPLPLMMGLFPEQRGLESFGNTPVRRQGDVEDVGGQDADEVMGGT